jgi:cytochrome b subunit of formate dehydrogenase
MGMALITGVFGFAAVISVFGMSRLINHVDRVDRVQRFVGRRTTDTAAGAFAAGVVVLMVVAFRISWVATLIVTGVMLLAGIIAAVFVYRSPPVSSGERHHDD